MMFFTVVRGIFSFDDVSGLDKSYNEKLIYHADVSDFKDVALRSFMICTYVCNTLAHSPD